MPNRNPAESSPEYQEMMAGHSPHKGLVDLGAESPTAPIETSPQPQASQPPLKPSSSLGDHLRKWTSHLFSDRKE